ncbi:N-acetyltransferase [Paraburkholderia sp. DHOC27]|nr:N-acetyltransferase [Paraburkholderia sp. DHOC27]
MRESLERIGRFDPGRAREGFLASFEPAFCRFILVDEVRAGLVQVEPEADHLLLNHFYIAPAYQGQGVGAIVLRTILADAQSRDISVRLKALRDSDSNRFYQRHGFTKTGESEWDIYYVREPVREPGATQ